MSALTVPHAELAAGDRVTGYLAGGHAFTLPEPREIAEDRRRAEDGAVALVRPGPNPHGVEWWLYPDQADAWVVERTAPVAEPVAAAPAPLNVGELDEDQVDQLALALARAVPHIAHHVPVYDSGQQRLASGYSYWNRYEVNRLGRPTAEQAKVGDVVLVGKYGKYQAAIVVKAGPKRLQLAHATPHGAHEAARGHWGRVFHPYEPRSSCYVLTTADDWAARVVRRHGAR